MMMDGMPGGWCGVRPLILSGASTRAAGGDRSIAGAGRRHHVIHGQGTRTVHLRRRRRVAPDRFSTYTGTVNAASE